MGNEGKRIALLIDAENASAPKIGGILTKLTLLGTIVERRAYGNWTSGKLKRWEPKLQEHAICRVQQSAVCKGKNASDIALVVGAMDLLHTGSFDAFAIVTSDSDFTPLVTRIATTGASVYGFGEKKTSKAFVSACTQFIYVESLSPPAPPAASRNLLSAKRLAQRLHRAVDAASDDDGWAHLSQVRKQLGDRASFDPRNYGHRKLGKLIESTGLFDVRRRNLIVHVRNRRTT